MKASRLFIGNNSQGAPVEAAQAIDGRWFYREYVFNGFGRGYTKWTNLEEDMVRVKEAETEDDRAFFEWGFSSLVEIEPGRTRLPA